MKKNIVIVVLGIIIIIQSVTFYVQKTHVKSPPTPAHEAVSVGGAKALIFAVKTETYSLHNTSYQMEWIRKHLEKTIYVLENKYKLEPLSDSSPEEQMISKPFVAPYEPPEIESLYLNYNDLKTDDGLNKLADHIDFFTTAASFINDDMGIRIDNYSERLKRLEPLLEKE